MWVAELQMSLPCLANPHERPTARSLLCKSAMVVTQHDYRSLMDSYADIHSVIKIQKELQDLHLLLSVLPYERDSRMSAAALLATTVCTLGRVALLLGLLCDRNGLLTALKEEETSRRRLKAWLFIVGMLCL